MFIFYSFNQENLNDSVKDALSTFRQQWQKELGSPSKQIIKPNADDGEAAAIAVPDVNPTESVEEIAKTLFLCGVDHEQNGKLFEAIRFYKRAVALIPDIEFRLYESTQKKAVRDDTLQVETGNGCTTYSVHTGHAYFFLFTICRTKFRVNSSFMLAI